MPRLDHGGEVVGRASPPDVVGPVGGLEYAALDDFGLDDVDRARVVKREGAEVLVLPRGAEREREHDVLVLLLREEERVVLDGTEGRATAPLGEEGVEAGVEEEGLVQALVFGPVREAELALGREEEEVVDHGGGLERLGEEEGVLGVVGKRLDTLLPEQGASVSW